MTITNLFASAFLGIVVGVLIIVIYNIIDNFLFKRKLNKIDKAVKPLPSVITYDFWQPLYDRFVGEITGEDIEFFTIPCGEEVWQKIGGEYSKGKVKSLVDTNLLRPSVIPDDCKIFVLTKIWIWTNRPEIREEAYLCLDIDGIEKSVYGNIFNHPIPEQISLTSNIIQRLPPLINKGSDNVSPAYKFPFPLTITKGQRFLVKLRWFTRPATKGEILDIPCFGEVVDIRCFLDGYMRKEKTRK